MLGMLLLMQINSVVFRHAHRLANGQIVTHAHPYNIFAKSCPLSANPHTSHELLLLDAVSNAVFVPTFVFIAVFLEPLHSVVNGLTNASLPVAPLLIALAFPTLRGPPLSAFFLAC